MDILQIHFRHFFLLVKVPVSLLFRLALFALAVNNKKTIVVWRWFLLKKKVYSFSFPRELGVRNFLSKMVVIFAVF